MVTTIWTYNKTEILWHERILYRPHSIIGLLSGFQTNFDTHLRLMRVRTMILMDSIMYLKLPMNLIVLYKISSIKCDILYTLILAWLQSHISKERLAFVIKSWTAEVKDSALFENTHKAKRYSARSCCKLRQPATLHQNRWCATMHICNVQMSTFKTTKTAEVA